MQDPNDPPVESEPLKLNGLSSSSNLDPEDPSATSVPGSILQNLIFLNWVQYPPLPLVPDLSDPANFSFRAGDEEFDVSNISNLFISSPQGGKIGAWYMLPTQSSGKVERLTKSDVVILYLHGNGFNRAQPHR